MLKITALPHNVDIESLKNGYCFVSLPKPDAVQQTITGMRDYFDQPPTVKLGDRRPAIDEWGYRPMPEPKELFMVRNAMLPPPLVQATQVWRQCHSLVETALGAVAGHLGLPAMALVDLADPRPNLAAVPSASVLRLLYYHPRQQGLAAEEHEDLGLLSYLPSSTQPALQILDYRDLAWHDIERPAKDAGILMVGRSLELLSRGRFPACCHRVMSTPVARYSLVYQARIRANAQIDSDVFGLSGYPPLIRGDDFFDRIRLPLKSVNGTY